MLEGFHKEKALADIMKKFVIRSGEYTCKTCGASAVPGMLQIGEEQLLICIVCPACDAGWKLADGDYWTDESMMVGISRP